jgi:hypothetical protein
MAPSIRTFMYTSRSSNDGLFEQEAFIRSAMEIQSPWLTSVARGVQVAARFLQLGLDLFSATQLQKPMNVFYLTKGGSPGYSSQSFRVNGR